MYSRKSGTQCICTRNIIYFHKDSFVCLLILCDCKEYKIVNKKLKILKKNSPLL